MLLLQAAATRAEVGGGVSICDASDAVRRLLDIAGVSRLLARFQILDALCVTGEATPELC